MPGKKVSASGIQLATRTTGWKEHVPLLKITAQNVNLYQADCTRKVRLTVFISSQLKLCGQCIWKPCKMLSSINQVSSTDKLKTLQVAKMIIRNPNKNWIRRHFVQNRRLENEHVLIKRGNRTLEEERPPIWRDFVSLLPAANGHSPFPTPHKHGAAVRWCWMETAPPMRASGGGQR